MKRLSLLYPTIKQVERGAAEADALKERLPRLSCCALSADVWRPETVCVLAVERKLLLCAIQTLLLTFLTEMHVLVYTHDTAQRVFCYGA